MVGLKVHGNLKHSASAAVGPGSTQTVHYFFVLFHLKKVVRLTILVEEEGGHRVDVGIRYSC